ncbi:MAG TPA: methyl-accepting chemotaxis protein [Ensifer sp.]|nr:methyl-accepting chemotaxis protein [Ensifer sp.]
MSFADLFLGNRLPRQIGDFSNAAALALVDPQGQVLWSNGAFQDLVGQQSAGKALPQLVTGGNAEVADAMKPGVSGSVAAKINGRPVKLTVSAGSGGQKLVIAEPAQQGDPGQSDTFDVIWDLQAIAVYGKDGAIIDASPLFCELAGYSRAELKGMASARLADPQDVQTGAHSQLWQRLQTEAKVSQVVKQVSKSGQPQFLQSSFYRIPGIGAAPDRIIQFADDATHRISSIAKIDAGVRQLSDGNLMADIKETLFPTVDGTRQLFNQALQKFRDAFQSVHATADAISAATGEITDAARNFSQRAEQQAAAIEETANSLNQVTEAASSASLRAEEAGRIVNSTREHAEQSSTIVSRAVEAMGRIEKSSAEIGSIIGVIDEIAFQTNLLALNAGVEAARAGDAGKGFAVVAQEVRELAQRSASAAKEIKCLVSASGENVRTGVSLVDEAGRALTHIASQIAIIDDHVSAIASATGEQARSIRDINSVVDRMEGGTQQNAAVAEETSASIQCLNDEIAKLVTMLSQFKAGDRAPVQRVAPPARPAAPSRITQPAPMQRAVRQQPSRSAAAARSSAALKQEGWEEF